MKKYIAIFLIIISVVSCKDFLEEEQVSVLTQDYYNSESGLETLIKGLYVYARVKHEWDANGTKLIDPETDQYMHVNTAFSRYSSASFGTDVSSIAANVNNFIGGANANYAPIGAYPHINNCNIALEIMESAKPGKFGSDTTFLKTRKAEVLFLRSWAYYLISNQLGDVPLLLKAKKQDDGKYYFPKEKLQTIYNQIISDVTYAYRNLPASQSDKGRITKWAAGHLLAKLYLNRAQAAGFENSSEQHLRMLFKGNVSSDLDSVISISTQVIDALKGSSGTLKGLAPDYWTLFDPKVSESTPSSEVLWTAQFDVNTLLNGRFGNRSCNYHTGNYTDQSSVKRAMAYGRPFGTYKPTDWGYDNFHDKVNDSRYYKSFAHEYIANMLPADKPTSYTWGAKAAAWWNANKPASEPTVTATQQRISFGKRAIIYLENQKNEALDSAMVQSQPYQFMVRWVVSSVTGRYYYRLCFDQSSVGLANTRATAPPYLSSKKWVDPTRGGSADEANFNSENGTRDAILMRLAETYLIRAEAYGRRGMYNLAVDDINVIRERAAYKSGETRHEVCALWEPQATSLPANERIAPYSVGASTYNAIRVTENNFTPGTPEATAENYIPTVTTKEDMFIHFIYNEKAREFLSEGLAWEDQHNAGILYDRLIYLNQMASNMTGLWPTAFNTNNGNGQDGNGKGEMQKHYTFRVWPKAYLDLLTDSLGKPLSAEAKAAYQNPGYIQ
jgi:hypothetical protein